MGRAIGIVATLLAVSLSTSYVRAQSSVDGALDAAATLVKALETSDIQLLVGAFDDEATVFMPLAGAPARLRGKAEIRQAFESLFKSAPPSAAPRTIDPREIATQ